MLNRRAFEELGLWEPASETSLRWRDGRPRVGTVVHRDPSGRPRGRTGVADLLYGARLLRRDRAVASAHARGSSSRITSSLPSRRRADPPCRGTGGGKLSSAVLLPCR
jgi:hypothetical protein